MKEQVAEIVAAYLRNNTVAASDVPAVITQVYQSLVGLGQPWPAEPEPTALKPAVPIRRSISQNSVVYLECGAKGAMLRRHLKTAHELTPAAYRQRWNLPTDYPLVAPTYAARRSAMAKSIGLGTSGRRGHKAAAAKA